MNYKTISNTNLIKHDKENSVPRGNEPYHRNRHGTGHVTAMDGDMGNGRSEVGQAANACQRHRSEQQFRAAGDPRKHRRQEDATATEQRILHSAGGNQVGLCGRLEGFVRHRCQNGAVPDFEGKRNVTIRPGKAVYCDPISYNLKPLQRLAITINYGGGLPEVATLHDGSRTTSYIIKGESKPKTKFANAEKAVHWYNIAALEVEGNGNSIAVLGNSITDGRGSTTDMQNRWTDIFAEALQKKGKETGVLNLGIGGNCVLWDGLGAAAVKRFDRDILGQKGVKALIIFEGVNDLGCSQDGVQTATRLIDSYKEMATKARKAGMKVYGATIMPFKGHDYYKPEHELGRKIVNLWIRESGYFDGYIDFDKLARDGNDPDALRKEWQEDWLHPNAEGYRVMGEYAAETMESYLGQ